MLTWLSLIKQKPRVEGKGKPKSSAFARQGIMRGRRESREHLLLDEVCEQESWLAKQLLLGVSFAEPVVSWVGLESTYSVIIWFKIWEAIFPKLGSSQVLQERNNSCTLQIMGKEQAWLFGLFMWSKAEVLWAYSALFYCIVFGHAVVP